MTSSDLPFLFKGYRVVCYAKTAAEDLNHIVVFPPTALFHFMVRLVHFMNR